MASLPRLPRRRPASAEEPPAPRPDADEPAPGRPSAVTPKKDRPTPRRNEAAAPARPRGPVQPPPQTRREAYRRMRDEGKTARQENRARLRSGDDSALPSRDRGPERRLVRDLADARRGPLVLFLPFFVIYSLNLVLPAEIQRYVTVALLGLLLVMGLEAVQLGRLVSTTVSARIPQQETSTRRLVTYGILRATLPRRLRTPTPKVSPGARV